MINDKNAIFKFYGITNPSDYKVVRVNASNLKIQHKITGKILDLRY